MIRFPHLTKFPHFKSNELEQIELVKLCTQVLDEFADVIDELNDASVRAALTGGKRDERIGALHKVRIANRAHNDALIEEYYRDFRALQQEMLEEPVLQYLPQSVQEGLAIIPERGMPRQAEEELKRAMRAVENSFETQNRQNGNGSTPVRRNTRHAAARAKRRLAGRQIGMRAAASAAR